MAITATSATPDAPTFNQEILDALDTLQESVNALLDLQTDHESKLDELIEKVDNLNLSSSDGLHLEYES